MRNLRSSLGRSTVASLALLLFACPRNADACSCVISATDCARAATAAAVFEATVDAIDPDAGGSGVFGSLSAIRLSNVKVYRGAAAAVVVTPGLGGSCGFPFEIGVRYLIVAGRSDDGRLMVTLCGLTRPVAAAAPLIEYVTSLANRVETRVWGTVYRSTPRGQAAPRPVQDAIVTLHGPKEIVTRTDASGRFLVTGLAHGSYSAAARVPAVDAILEPYMGDFELEPGTPHACAEVEFEVPATGHVTGLVLDERGDPLPGAFVQLQVVNSSGAGKPVLPWLGTETDNVGRYYFFETPPGSYQVAFGSIEGQIHARTSAGMTAFTVNDGESITLEPLHRRTFLRLETEVLVQDADGKPVAGVEVQPLILIDGDEPFLAGPAVASDAEGRLVVSLLNDQRYRLVVGSHRAPRADSKLVADGSPVVLVLRR